MQEALAINGHCLTVKEYEGKRVVTFRDIDVIHERPEGTTSRNFKANRKHFIEGEDFYLVKHSDFQKDEIRPFEIPNRGITVFTETGYMMLVKSFTDDLAWTMQRELVNGYFRAKKIEELNGKIPEKQAEFNKMIMDGYLNLQNVVGGLAAGQDRLFNVVEKAISVVEKVTINSQNNQTHQNYQNNVVDINQHRNIYSEWRKLVNEQIGFLATCREVPSQVVLSELYMQMNSEYGHDLTRIQRAATINKGYGVSTISIVEEDETLRRDFTYLLNEQVEEYRRSGELQGVDHFRCEEDCRRNIEVQNRNSGGVE
jgi:ORF6N domain.